MAAGSMAVPGAAAGNGFSGAAQIFSIGVAIESPNESSSVLQGGTVLRTGAAAVIGNACTARS